MPAEQTTKSATSKREWKIIGGKRRASVTSSVEYVER